MFEPLAAYWPMLVVVVSVGVLVTAYFHHGLNRYPGPFLARFTDLWRVVDVSHDHHEQTMIALHRQYGSVVRIGPNTVSISSPDYIPRIYGINKGYVKTPFYNAMRARANGKPTTSIFAERDEQTHTFMKKAIVQIYSMSSLTSYEPLVDDTIRLFMDRLEQEFSRGADERKPCDMADWLQYYAFDVVLNLTFSNTLGFLEQGRDVDGFVNLLDVNMSTSALMASMPWTTIFRFNPIIGYLAKENNAFPRFVGRQIQEHGRKLQESKMSGGDVSSENGTRDFLYRFMMIHASKPEVLPQADIFKACMANVVAGSDTTAITLRAIMYLVLKHPEVKAKLLQELREGNLSFPVTWKESQQLPYLDACVKEALRVHPAVGMGLERFVPKEGLVMPDGHTLPEGTQVCMNAYVVHQDTSIFGADASVFNPDRWLQAEGESDDAYESRMASMKRTDLAFGWGKRICLGRNISYLEIYKAVPTLLLEFDIELVNEGNWKTSNRFFVRQSNMDCYLKRRVR